MRPGNQSNKRMRGRGRKGPNPLSRSYESNGPDVKIRGTAQHIAEKYQQLARDAQASGDRIMSENYLQHAEHYQRIVAAAQAHLQPAAQPSRSESDDSSADNAANPAAASGAGERKERAETPAAQASENMIVEDSPQPFIEDMPVIDAAGQVNGHAADETDGSGNAEDDDAKPRRRPRGTRGRGVKRVGAEGADEAPVEAAAEGAPASASEEEAPKPRARRAPRARKPKPAEETSESDALPAGE
jgi:hypothetical protein